MTALVFLAVLVLGFAAAWAYLSRNPHPKAKLGPDGTNVREPETFVVHHEGKGQGLDIANTALKKRTEDVRRDLPGDLHKVKVPVPGRDMIRMQEPPSDESRYGDEKVAPGSEPKEKVLMEGPIGSRPGTPEQPGSPYAKGRRVTDNHRDAEMAADLHPSMEPGAGHRPGRDLASSPSTNGQEPGYGLGQTVPGETDGEGGPGDESLANLTEGERTDPPRRQLDRGRVIMFRARTGSHTETADEEISFRPDPSWAHEMGEEIDWSGLHEDLPLPANYGEDMVAALVRNPRSLYIYWERSGMGDENMRAMLGEAEFARATPCLRVYDLTSGAYPGQQGGRVTTIDVDEADNHWFVHHGIEPGRRYIVSFERRTAGGRYYMLSHSAPVSTPNDRPTPEAEREMLYQLYVGRPGQGPGSRWR